jgi:hypothetical protein
VTCCRFRGCIKDLAVPFQRPVFACGVVDERDFA